MREICLDTETTGLDPKDGHRIIEVACVEVINKVRTGKSFQSYINPLRDVPDEAFKIHGISTESLKDKPTFDRIVKELLEFIGESKLVIHNASFDMKFLNHHLREVNIEIIERRNVVDSLELARAKFPGAGNSLDALCKRFGVDASRRTKHGALLDAELLADIYIELMGGNQISMFDTNVENNGLTHQTSVNENSYSLNSLPKRDFPVSEADLEAHKKFILKNFKENLWEY